MPSASGWALDNEDTGRQIREALAFIGDRSPASFGGDFNAEPDSPVAAAVRDAGFADPFTALGIDPAPLTDPAVEPTHASTSFGCGAQSPYVPGCRIRSASDHRMVVVEVKSRRSADMPEDEASHLHYELHATGGAGAPLVVLLHGLGSCGAGLGLQLPLSTPGYRVLHARPSRPRPIKTGASLADIPGMAGAVDGLLESSWGGRCPHRRPVPGRRGRPAAGRRLPQPGAVADGGQHLRPAEPRCRRFPAWDGPKPGWL